MRKFLLVIFYCLAFVGLVLPATAQADIQTDLNVAYKYWAGTTCADQRNVSVLSDPRYDDQGIIAGQATGVTVNTDGSWTLRACEITIAPGWYASASPADGCAMIVHEIGHLALEPHRADDSIMQPTIKHDFQPCLDAYGATAPNEIVIPTTPSYVYVPQPQKHTPYVPPVPTYTDTPSKSKKLSKRQRTVRKMHNFLPGSPGQPWNVRCGKLYGKNHNVMRCNARTKHRVVKYRARVTSKGVKVMRLKHQ